MTDKAKIKRLNSKIKDVIIDTDKCIVPSLPKDKDGYITLQVRQNGVKKHFRGHRISYELFNNVKLIKNDLICHHCDNPSCINPKHLFKGSHADNVKDKVSKGRQAKGKDNGRYKHGHYSKYDFVKKAKPEFNSLYNRNLKKEQVLLIKKSIENRGDKTLKELSNEFSISYQTIKDIHTGRSYINV